VALAIQIVLSFGHVHLSPHRAPPAFAALGMHGAVAVQASRQGPAQSPSDDTDDYCAICATIFLASTSFVSPAPVLPAPASFERVVHSVSVAFGLVIEPRRVAFQSRAPPLA
jgi:hypothetical protein